MFSTRLGCWVLLSGRCKQCTFLVWLMALQLVDAQGTLSFFRPGSPVSESISESATVGTDIYELIATGGAGGYVYRVSSQSPPTPLFIIDSSTGKFTSPAGLDAETTQTFTFTFNCTSGSESITSVLLTLHVTDENDNTPYFTNEPYSVQLSITSIHTGMQVLNVTANDADVTPATLSFHITGGDTINAFSIVTNTGELRIENSSNILPGIYSLAVQVSDGMLTNSTTVTINVQVLTVTTTTTSPLTSSTHSAGVSQVSENSISSGLIVAIVVSIAVPVVAVTTVTYLFLTKKKRSNFKDEKMEKKGSINLDLSSEPA